jgi:hypothetical protein
LFALIYASTDTPLRAMNKSRFHYDSCPFEVGISFGQSLKEKSDDNTNKTKMVEKYRSLIIVAAVADDHESP